MAKFKMIDIAANLTDGMFKGIYNGKQYHVSDISEVLKRAWEAGVERIIVTGGSLKESKEALAIAETDGRLFCTVGVHPTRCKEFEESGNPEHYFQELVSLAKEGVERGKVVAIGECGLDYDRLQFCPADVQRQYFEKQFELADALRLPMFLHMRAAGKDFCDIIEQNRHRFISGVAHSFTGCAEDRDQLLKFDNLFIGINGCSLKTVENLQVLAGIPLERMMIETDAPYCEIRSTHAGAHYIKSVWSSKKKEKFDPGCTVKNRNEPCFVSFVEESFIGQAFQARGKILGGINPFLKNIQGESACVNLESLICILFVSCRQVLEVVAGQRGIEDVGSLAKTLYANTCRVFFPHDLDTMAGVVLGDDCNI